MEHAADLMIFAGVVLLFVSLFGAILFLFVGLYRDEKWESNEQPDDLGRLATSLSLLP